MYTSKLVHPPPPPLAPHSSTSYNYPTIPWLNPLYLVFTLPFLVLSSCFESNLARFQLFFLFALNQTSFN